jgi:hypothetical protein
VTHPAQPARGGYGDPLAPLLDLPGVGEGVVEAREAIDRLRAHRVMRRRSTVITTESCVRGAHASAVLEGVDAALATFRSGETTHPLGIGALRASLGLGELVNTWRRAPLQALARLHVLASAHHVPDDQLGRPTRGAAVSARLDGLSNLVTGGSHVAAPVLVAVVHGELLSLRPFGSANGIVARSAARLTAVSTGLDPTMASVPEVGHLALRDEYATALAGYAGGSPDGVATWLRHCCAALVLGAREGLAICESVSRG